MNFEGGNMEYIESAAGYKTLVDVIRDKQGNQKGILFVKNRENEFFLSYDHLYKRALQWLHYFQEDGLEPGDELVFQVEDNCDFVCAFWACLLGKIVPVPVTMGGNDEYRLKLFNIWNILERPHLITSKKHLENLKGFASGKEWEELFDTVQANTVMLEKIGTTGERGVIHVPDESDTAFIQFSSGSTGEPKGVVLTHGNLVINTKDILTAMHGRPEDKMFSWMPLTHDMGMIAFHLTPLVGNWEQVLMPPQLFIRYPGLWMQKISETKSTITCSPNFGYKYVLKHFTREGYKGVELSSLRLIVNGAEPISSPLCHEFLDALAPLGLKRKAMFPAYGLAEASVAVSFSEPEAEMITVTVDRESLKTGEKVKVAAGKKNTVSFVNVGTPVEKCFLKIAGDDGKLLEDGYVGHIFIKGENVTSGYYNNTEATARVMTPEGWLKTGDLGFQRNGHLYITGRAKDILFVNGQNYYSHDIERLAEELEEIDFEKVVVCDAFNAGLEVNQVIAFVVFRRKIKDFLPLADNLRRHVLEKAGLEIDNVIPVKQIPKTTSGKIQRYKLKKMYLDGAYEGILQEIETLSEEQGAGERKIPESEMKEQIARIWQEVLKIEHVAYDDNFFDLGGNSLKAGIAISKIGNRLNIDMSLSVFFKKPTINELVQGVNDFKEKRHSPIDLVEKREYYELSSAQKRMFTLHQLDSQSTSYNLPIEFILEGEPVIKKIEEAFGELIRRHEILRTSFLVLHGQIVQKIADSTRIKVEYHELKETAKETMEVKTNALVRHFIRPFDLTQVPLLRVGLVKQMKEKYIFLFDAHHIILDGGSIEKLINDFLIIYGNGLLPGPAFQYKDFSHWQNRRKENESIKKQGDYWLREFQGEFPLLNLPYDYARPEHHAFEGKRISFEISSEETKALKGTALVEGGTLYLILLTIYNIFLSKLSNQRDIIIGSPMNDRKELGMERSIGLFINILALRNYPLPKKAFREFFAEVRRRTLEAFDNQDYQFEDLVAKLEVQRSTSRNPLFDTMLVLQDMKMGKIESPSLKLKPYRLHHVPRFDFTLETVEEAEKLVLAFGYNTTFFKKETVERFVLYFKEMVSAILKHPEKTIAEQEMIPGTEKHRLLVEFNNTQREYPNDKTIHELFEDQVLKTPEHVALQFGSSQLTYDELNKSANRLAWVLKGNNLKPETIVGLMMERSLEMIVGILGILKAGGAYLPFFPDLPNLRIQNMIEDARIQWLLTKEHILEHFSYFRLMQRRGRWSAPHYVRTELYQEGEGAGNLPMVDIIFIDFDTHTFYRVNDQFPQPQYGNLSSATTAEKLSYVIYTSGSTGKPKGVAVAHGNAVNTLLCRKEDYEMQAGDSALQLFSYAFDGFVTSFFTPVISGAKAVLLPEDDSKDIERIKKIMIRNRITHVLSVPSLYRAILESMDETELKTLSVVTLAGDILSPGILEQTRKKAGHIEISHEYGVTEVAVMSTIRRHQQKGDIVTIGKPIWNTGVLILNKEGGIQPIGVPGEIYIFGAGVARGYLNQPELTAQRFVTHPFSKEERVYRTGDLGRWMHNGNIEFLGRVDSQVKIRGFRIELGEIEHILWSNESVKEAVVVARKNSDNNNYLAAYYAQSDTNEPQEPIPIVQLRDFLSEKLPDYMIPSYFVPLKKLPLTPSGKIDRKALPEPVETARTGEVYQAPSNETEAKLVQIWQDVLAIEKIGINDNFFVMGGHSLKATNLISKIKKIFQVELPLTALFEKPSIKGLARYISKSVTSIFTAIEAVEIKDYYPVSSAQKRLYTLNRFAPEGVNYNMPNALLIEGDLSTTHFEEVFKKLIKRHESLRTSFHFINGEPVQRIHDDVVFNVKFSVGANLSVRPDLSAFLRPFDLSRAPLLRVELVKLEEHRHLFLFDMHHIVSDGISMDILVKEISDLYAGLELKPLTVQYKDYAGWQNRVLESENLLKQKRYWLEKFTGEIPVPALPTDYPRPTIQSFEGETITFEIDEKLTEELYRLAGEHGGTLYMVLLAQFNILLSKYSGQEDIIVGSPSAGRRHTDLENIIGMFVNTLTMRNAPQAEKSFVDFLVEVKQNSLEAFENQDYQFDDLLEHLDLKRDLGRNPLFDTMFILQNLERAALELKGLTSKSYELKNKISKFDITMQVLEGETKLLAHLGYCARLFKKETMERFASHYVNILKEAVTESTITLGKINMLSEAEEDQLLYQFNNTQVDTPGNQTIHEVFEEQVRKTPTQVVLQFGNSQLTYDELNKRANRLAWTLRGHNIRPGTIVGLMIERSFEMIIGILGILKAGAAYLPILPDQPKTRIQTMIEDSRIRWLLTKENNIEHVSYNRESMKLPNREWIRPQGNAEDVGSHPVAEIRLTELEQNAVHRVDGETLQPQHDSFDKISSEAGVDDLCYIIYTSGSTGKPKGVAVGHGSVVNTLQCRKENYNMQVGDSALQLFSYAFDGFVTSFFTPVISGAKVVQLSEDDLKTVDKIRKILVRNRITHILSVPALYRAILEISEEAELKTLRVVTLAGDILSQGILEQTGKKAPHVEIAHEYGITEVAVMSTIRRCQQDYEKVTIGKPIWNTAIYVVNRDGGMQPVGVPGDIYIGGAGVARGYLNRPELTAARFVTHTFSKKERMFHTGDQARWMPDGNLEFLGRLDRQVKVRGYRIELGEIEKHIGRHEGVKDVVTGMIEGTDGQKKLIAYYVEDENKNKQPELWPSVAEFFIYDDLLYYAMTNDEHRNNKYKIAIKHFVKDKTVVDVGTGKDAILARFCAEAGAKKVYALEILEDSYKKAGKAIREDNLEDKITLIHGDATKVKLPEEADICVQEIVGSIGGSEGAAAILNKVKDKLKDDAVMIPEKSITKITAVRLPNVIHNKPSFSGLPREYAQKVFDDLGYNFDLRLCIRNFPEENIISNTDTFEDLDFSGNLREESVDKINLVITEDSRLDGFLVWLNLHLMPGVVIDILEHEYCWLPIFVPVFYPGVEVTKGDKIETTCIRMLCENRINPDFTLKGLLKREGREDIAFEYDMAHFEKSYRKTEFYRRLFDEASRGENGMEGEYKPLDVSSLREFLENRLPGYMIPAHFKKIEKIPLTSNGKIDMKALESQAVELSTGMEYVPPKDESEQKIAAIWKEVLGINKIGTQDNFFEIGGNSLNVISAKAKLNAVLGMDIPVTLLFEHMTIHALARWVNEAQRGENVSTPSIDLSGEIKQMKKNRKRRIAKRGGQLNV